MPKPTDPPAATRIAPMREPNVALELLFISIPKKLVIAKNCTAQSLVYLLFDGDIAIGGRAPLRFEHDTHTANLSAEWWG